MDPPNLPHLIDVAAGRTPADLVLRGGRVANVFTGQVEQADVAFADGFIAGVGAYEGHEVVPLDGRIVCPGLIDAHVHIESSLLSVPEYARLVAAHGTTAVVADPHEFANVMGAEGIRFVLRTAKNAPIDVFVMLSSCVPASPFEGAGAELDAVDLLPFLSDPWVRGIAEMMNYPGIVAADPAVLDKIKIAGGRVVDGHAPGLGGRDLAAYAAAGIHSDHECITAEDAWQKLRCGLHVIIREGSQTRNLEALRPVITPETAHQLMVCTDDKTADDLLAEGHINYILRRAIGMGVPPMLALRLATLNPARYFGLARHGAVAPGYRANLAIIDDWPTFNVHRTYRDGELTALDGRCTRPGGQAPHPVLLRSTINIDTLRSESFIIPATPGSSVRVNVIDVLENRIDTHRAVEPVGVGDRGIVADPARDLCKLAVIERHRASGDVGLGLVRGFGLKRGALASSVAHDAHNLIIVGVGEADMLLATAHLVKMRGGLCVVDSGRVVADLPLPIAGLVSDQPADAVAARNRALLAAAAEIGCRLQQPFMALSFLSLSVIGKLKLTHRGLIDVDQFRLVPLLVEA